MEQNIQMLDLKTQYHYIKDQIDIAVVKCISSTAFINGPAVKEFQTNLEAYLGVKHVIFHALMAPFPYKLLCWLWSYNLAMK